MRGSVSKVLGVEGVKGCGAPILREGLSFAFKSSPSSSKSAKDHHYNPRPYPDPWEDPKKTIPLKVSKNDPIVEEGTIWGLYFLDPPRGLGNGPKPKPNGSRGKNVGRMPRTALRMWSTPLKQVETGFKVYSKRHKVGTWFKGWDSLE